MELERHRACEADRRSKRNEVPQQAGVGAERRERNGVERHESIFFEDTMLARVITLRFSAMLDGFDDAPLRDFLKDKDVHALRDHFFVRHDTPYLAVVVNYSPAPLPPPAVALTNPAATRNKHDESWRHLVSEADVPLFNALRDWRAARCKRDGVPPYVICTNRQLAAMVPERPQTLAALGRISRSAEIIRCKAICQIAGW
jgi:ATP-dependent DNA helicase RecQ